MPDDSVLEKLTRRLASRSRLDAADRGAVLALPYQLRAYAPVGYLVREGETPRKYCSFILSGLALRQKLTADGARQIVAIHMSGELLDVQHLFLNCADHNVQALTRLEVAEIDREALQAVVLDRPAVGRAMWVQALIDSSIYREWMTNIGRRGARARIAHLVCEFAIRAENAGIAIDGGYDLPMSQEQLGDALGLTAVHVNRTLKVLESEGLIVRDRRFIRVADWLALRAAADFNDRYLHLDQTGGEQA